MAEAVPAIRLTDPHSNAASPTYANGQWDGDFRKPTAPASKQEQGTRERSSPSPVHSISPARHIRSVPNNIIHALHGSSQPAPTSSPATLEHPPTIDPVTQQILERTGESFPPPKRVDSDEPYHSAEEQEAEEAFHLHGPPSRVDTWSSRAGKRKEHRVSFFSRLIGGKKKEEEQDIAPDNVSIAESRAEGHDAEIFSPSLNNNGFVHSLAHMPKYIRTRTRHAKKKQHFDNLFLAQELAAGFQEPAQSASKLRKTTSTSRPRADESALWAAEWSKDGKYLATAGHDKIVRVWAVITTPEERYMEARHDSNASAGSSNQSFNHAACIFKSKPIREYKGHTSTILDLSWSKNNFLISSSMDMTVRLWHVSRPQCLCTFKHADMIPAIAFHPRNDRFFLAGSLDSKVRLWSVSEKRVVHWAQAPSMVTAVSFAPDGRHCFSGCADGSVQYYETEALKYLSQLKIKCNHKSEKGSKVTGVQAFQYPQGTGLGDTKVLVTSNDSRIRMYNLRDKSLELKMKGGANTTCQIRASLSEDLRYVCSGSEDSRAYIWPLDPHSDEDPMKQPVELFQAHSSTVTCVRFAPGKTKQLISRSTDPIFDLCSPALVQTTSNGEPQLERKDSQASSSVAKSESAPELVRRKSETVSTPSSLRCSHHAGNIIVTTSSTGAIKVFRQDCAAKHRQSSSSASRRITSTPISINGNSLKNRSSNRSLRSTSTQAPSDRILSWRQTVNPAQSRREGSISSMHSARSLSPRKSSQIRRSASGPDWSSRNETNNIRSSGSSTPAQGSTHNSPQVPSNPRMPKISGMTPINASPTTRQSRLASSPQPITSTTLPRQRPSSDKHVSPRDSTSDAASDVPETPEHEPAAPAATAIDKNPLHLHGEQSDLFWDTAVEKRFADRAHHRSGGPHAGGLGLKTIISGRRASESSSLFPPTRGQVTRGSSFVSRLSIERSEGGSDAGADEEEG